MDSLLLICACHIVALDTLPAVPEDLYPVLFLAAFLHGRLQVLQDLVSTWPFPELNFQRLVGRRELLQGHLCDKCVPAVIQAVVTQLRQDLEKPGRDSGFRLRVLDITGLPDKNSVWCSTDALAKACMEVSKHQQEFQCRRSKRHKGCSGAATAVAAPQSPGVDVHADLVIGKTSYEILRNALRKRTTSLLRLKCRELRTELPPRCGIVNLLKSLDPSCVRRVSLPLSDFASTSLSTILSRFPVLQSLKLNCHFLWGDPLLESPSGIQCLAMELGMLPSLRELNLGYFKLSGNLHQILCDLQAPLESLKLASCSLLPADLTFLSQSFHARALKRLDLSGHNFSQYLLEPLQLLLEQTSASLLHLNLRSCFLADSHLDALLPTILRCSRLRFLGLYGNSLSMAAVKNFLQKTLELPDLRLVVYPFPEDCCNLDPALEDKRLAAVRVRVEVSRMLANSGRTDLIWTDYLKKDQRTALDYFSL